MIKTQEPITKQKFDLEERTLEFAKNIVRLCTQLPQNAISRELIAQLIRSGGSVGANYREANDSLSKKDFYYRIRITRKEAKETYYWLELLRESLPEHQGRINILLAEAIELKKIFSSIADKA
jgi:four helix bundle protein